MRRYWLHLLLVGAIAIVTVGHSGRSTGQIPMGGGGGIERRYPDFATVVKGAKEYDGLFKLHHKEDQLYAEIMPHQFNQPLLCPIAIAQGVGEGGHQLNNDEQWVLVFKKVNERIFLVRRNVRFQARPGSPIARAVETTYTDSVLMSLRIVTTNPMRGSVVISLNDIFMTDFAQLGRGYFDASRSTWHKVKAFPKNIEIQVAATYAGGGRSRSFLRSDDSVIDDRGATVVVHYGLCQMPDMGYSPRLADDRVGYFLSVVKDFTSDTKQTPFLRYVNRWRLERVDGSPWREGGKLVPPKKKIVFWIEKSVPDEYRAYVRDGILEWNKAFAKVGFRDAIEVRQQESEDFDPEDATYNTFRWIANDGGYAMGPSRANPLTGEIFDADIVFDASMVRYYRQSGGVFSGSGSNPTAREDVSPMRAYQRSMGLAAREHPGTDSGWDTRPTMTQLDPLAKARLRAVSGGLCECGPSMKRELHLLAMAMYLRDNEAGPPVGPNPPNLTEELIGQAIKETVMHEVGHTLGLRHNFKASTMLKNGELHDTKLTREKGLVGSVMDYNPINLAPKGVKQGDFFTNTIGPYDYWAIEYAYKPLGGGTEGEYGELAKIAGQIAKPGHDFSTDEDLYSSSDPYVNVWDLGNDPMKFAQDRILLAEELLAKLAEKGTGKGESFDRTRAAFGVLLNQYGDGAHLISKFIGGVAMNRDHDGDPSGRDPMVVVSPAKQREALAFLQKHILTDKPFEFPPKLLRRLGSDRWLHWGNYRSMFTPVEYPIHERILDIQTVVLDHALSGATLSRIQNNALKAEKDAKEKPLQIAEVFRGLTDAIWADPINGKNAIELSIVKRNLQREYVKELTRLVLRGGYNVPPDARSLARLHLKTIDGKIDRLLANENVNVDDTSKAHLQETKERIGKALTASMQVVAP